jgi:DNA primase
VLCAKLGLLGDRAGWTKHAHGVVVRCVWHEDRSPSLDVRLAKDGTIGCVCYACGATGDALSLIAASHGIDPAVSFREVLRVAADLACMPGLLDDEAPRPIPAPRPRAVPPPAERTYPPEHELASLFDATSPVTDDAEVSGWLAGRGISPDLVAELNLARAIRRDACALPRFATYKGRSWLETGHRLIVPVYDERINVRSVRCGRVRDDDSPKRLPPSGYRATGLVMADAAARAMLAGERKAAKLCVVEGEPDFLTWATRAPKDTAVIGLTSGAWCPLIAMRVPSGTPVFVRTDHDPAGDKYAEEVSRSLRARCTVFRSTEVR